MRKILIASLGAGDKKREYKIGNYNINGRIYTEKYIAAALDKEFKMDKIFYIGTLGSMWENIYIDYCKGNSVNIDENYKSELELKMLDFLDMTNENKKNVSFDFMNLDRIKDISKGKINPILTRYGLDDKENFENFNQILKIIDELQDGDEIYLDITHSFRSNAFWIFLVMNYINDVADKNINIKYISYGMFEAKEKNEKGIEVVPVVNLKLFLDLTKWIKGAYSFKNFGNSTLIRELLDESGNEKIKNKLENFSNSININYVSSIKENINYFKRNLEIIDKIDGPGKLIIPKIVREFLEHFNGTEEEYDILLRLAKWHYKEERYAMVYTNLIEAIKSYIIKTLDIYSDEEEEYFVLDKKISYAVKKIEAKLRNNTQKKFNELNAFFKTYKRCKQSRNNIAHSGNVKKNIIMKEKTESVANDIRGLKDHILICEKIFKQNKLLQEFCSYYMINYEQNEN